jgi:hypothetical protein
VQRSCYLFRPLEACSFLFRILIYVITINFGHETNSPYQCPLHSISYVDISSHEFLYDTFLTAPLSDFSHNTPPSISSDAVSVTRAYARTVREPLSTFNSLSSHFAAHHRLMRPLNGIQRIRIRFTGTSTRVCHRIRDGV